MGKFSDKLARVAPPPSLASPGMMVDAVPDIDRILALPRRPPVDCSRVEGLYAPATQALVEVETGKLARPPRLSCACRARHVQLKGETLIVTREVEEGATPEPPLIVSRAAFLADCSTPGDQEAARIVGALEDGGEARL